MAMRQVWGEFSIPSPNPSEHPSHSYNFKSNKLNHEISKNNKLNLIILKVKKQTLKFKRVIKV